jgi:Domain of unknown function (DUF5668)/B-box zinc finger
MKCAQHTDVDATGYCRQCGKPMCPACTRDVRGALYCEDCLAGIVAPPLVAATPAAPGYAAASPLPPGTSAGTHPGTALALGFIPGLGAVYNGEYVKGLIHVAIFAGIIAGLSSDPPGGILALLIVGLICFYFYMPIEAYRTAKARQQGEPQIPGLVTSEGRVPMGAIVLIGLGVLFLLANFHLLEREWFSKAWPLGLIALGVWIMYDRMKRTS